MTKKPSQPKKPNAKQPWVDAVEFALTECVRFVTMVNDAMRDKTFSQLPGSEFLYELRGADGRKYTYGREAQRRLEEVAESALSASRFGETVSFERYMETLKPAIVERFITKGVEVDLASVDSAFSSALNDAAKARGDSRHFIPCQLMFQAEPDSFSIGPVTFRNRETFKPVFDELVKENRARETNTGKPTIADEVIGYFANFTWVAEVTVKGCDRQIGKERAIQAVGAAVDFMHVMFGHYHSRNMVVGGPGLDADIRAEMEVRDGETKLGYSIGSTSAMGFPDGWSSMLDEPEAKGLINAAGRAIEAVTDPARSRPLALRFVDAAAWHGQAVRETSAAASIVKSVTALERLVTVKKGADTTRIVTERNAALSYDPRGTERFADVVKRMEGIYDLRSRLAHGTLSPFDPEVRHRRYEVLAAAEKSLINGLDLFDQDGLFDRTLSKRELTEGLESLVDWVKRVDAQKAATAAAEAAQVKMTSEAEPH